MFLYYFDKVGFLQINSLYYRLNKIESYYFNYLLISDYDDGDVYEYVSYEASLIPLHYGVPDSVFLNDDVSLHDDVMKKSNEDVINSNHLHQSQ